jgi:AcrR family transcriptional regulator
VTARREQILTVARDLFLEHGPKGLSMRRVAARVGISATAIYRHYQDKGALLGAVVTEGFQVFASYLFRALEGQTPLERLVLAGHHYLRFALEQPKYYQLIFMSWTDDAKPDLGPEHAVRPQRPEPTYQFLLDRVDECIRERVFRGEVRAEDAAIGIWSQVHGLAALYLAGGARYQFTAEEYLERARLVVEQMMHGLLAT